MDDRQTGFKERAASSLPHAEAVATMAAAGETNGAIAAALGLSRNSVIGLRRRLGVPSGRRVAAVIAVGTPSQRSPEAAIRIEPAIKPLPAALLVAFDAPAGSRPVPFAQLRRGGCKWPYGEGTAILFCGTPALTTARGTARPYCACHSALAARRRSLDAPVVDKTPVHA